MDDPNEIEELHHYEGPDRVISSVEYWKMIKDEKPPVRHLTGLPLLDESIEGFEPGEVIVISGPTAMGKTTLCQTIMANMSGQGKRALFFSYENDPKKVAYQHREDKTCIYLPLDHRPMSILWLEKRCVEAALKYADLSAIFIDHLHYVVDMASKNNMSLEIGQTMRFIKQNLAIGLKLPVFLVAHMVKIPLLEEPSMSHLRDSALIACEADTVLVLWRQWDVDFGGKPIQTMSQNRAILKVEKARRSGTMARKIEVCKDNNRLIELK